MRPIRRPAPSPALRLVEGGAGRSVGGAAEAAAAAGRVRSRIGALLAQDPVERSLEAAGRRDAARLAALAAGLTCFGTVMVLFASPVASIADYGSPFSLFERQLLWVVLGFVGYALAVRLDLRRLRRLSRPALVGAMLLLLIVLVPHLGKAAYGSSRWIGAGPFRLQPSELSKLCFALFCADLVARRRHARDQWREIVRPLAIVLAVACILILKQPDLGTAVVVACVALGVLYAGGIRRRLLAGFATVLGVGGGILAMSASYRRARLLSFVNPFAHASTTGYQVVQSLVSLGSGHLTGSGGTAAVAPWFLPNAETDFIFAVIGNDLGLLGGVLVLLGFLAFGLLGVRIALRTVDPFARLLVTAITCWTVLQALVNIGGVVGALPETGIPLPFLSYGGSSLIVVLFATGLVVRIGRNPRLVTETVPPVRAGRSGAAVHPSRRPVAVHPSRRPVAVRSSGQRVAQAAAAPRRPRATVPSTGARRREAGGGGR